MNFSTRRAVLVTLLLTANACSFHSTATHWNGRYDADGRPVFVKSTTNIGFNLLILLPILGNVTLDSMIDEATAEIAKEGGTRVRVIQTGSENYWYGWSPLTWIVTPVVTDVSFEYEPSTEALAKAQADDAEFQQREAERRQQDNRHVIPEPR